MEPLQQAFELKAELDKLRPINKEQEAIIMQKFRLDWNYHSNHLEGNSLTHGETKALILFGITAQGKPLKDHFEITGHNEALNWVLDIVKEEYPLTENFIRELHTLLLKESYEVNAITLDGQATKKRVEVGKYKSTPNHVKTKTGEIFRFANPEETPAMMHDLIEWYREKKNSHDVNPIILAAEFHYKFIRIHPFDDGNGRTARILMNFILMQFGYPPVIIKTEDKENYFSALQQADAGIITPFIDYIASNLVRSLTIMIAGAKGESIEDPDDFDKEIALLEQKVKAVGTKIEISKTKEAIIEIFDKSIVPLWVKFISSSDKIREKFYIQSNWGFFVNGGQQGTDKGTILVTSRNRLDENTHAIQFTYGFLGFNQTKFEELSHSSRIEIKFGLTFYSVIAENGLKRIDKLYNEQLTEEEITEIIKIVSRHHTAIIENKLKEIQRNKT